MPQAPDVGLIVAKLLFDSLIYINALASASLTASIGCVAIVEATRGASTANVATITFSVSVTACAFTIARLWAILRLLGLGFESIAH